MREKTRIHINIGFRFSVSTRTLLAAVLQKFVEKHKQAHNQPIREDVQASHLRGVTRGMYGWLCGVPRLSATRKNREQDMYVS